MATAPPSGDVAVSGRFTPRPLRMIAVTVGWGACFAVIQYGLADAPPLWFAALRALLAGLALLAVGVVTRRPMPRPSHWPAIGLLGVVNVTLAFAAMFTAAHEAASGVASVLANAQPILIVIPAWLLYRERPDARIIAGLLVGFAGLVVVAVPGGVGEGALPAIGTAVAIAAGTLIARRLTGIDVVMLSAWQFLIGGAALAGWAALAEGPMAVRWAPGFILALGFLALIGTALTYLLWFAELFRAPLTAVSAWTMLTPVVGVLIGWVLLAERATPAQVAGISLVLIGLAVIMMPRRLGRPRERSRTPRSDTPRSRHGVDDVA